MAYNEVLAIRMRSMLGPQAGLVEKKMFGGVAFLLNGHMACGVHGQDLIVRVGPEQSDSALARPHTRIFNMTGRPMAGWVVVETGEVENNKDLSDWVSQGIEFAKGLPAKTK